MPKHSASRICKVSEITADMLTFPLTQEQLARVPSGKKIKFRKSTSPYKDKGYRHLIARAEYDIYVPEAKKTRNKAIATRLIGIIWDDDPEWLYETDKSKSSIKERRIPAAPTVNQASGDADLQVSSIFAECLEYKDPESAVIVRRLPVSVFLTVAVCCAMRGITDPAAVAGFWNQNLGGLRKLFPAELFPAEELQEISHETVTRVCMSLTEKSVKDMIRSICERVLPTASASESELRTIVPEARSCRASYHDEIICQMMMDAADVISGRQSLSHTVISAKSQELKPVSEWISELNIQGAMVSANALHASADVAQAIVNAGGFYLLPVDDHQPSLLEALKTAEEKIVQKTTCSKNPKEDHSDKAKWRCVIIPANVLPKSELTIWPGLESGCLIRTEAKTFEENSNGACQAQEETHWFITCYPYPFADSQSTGEDNAKAEEKAKSAIEWISACVRARCGIKTADWCLDWSYRQDQIEFNYPAVLRTRTLLAKIGQNLLNQLQQIEERCLGTGKPRSESDPSRLISVTLEDGLRSLQKIADFRSAIS